ncbi:potassium channel family protein [Psychrobacter sp. UBA5136]|uniref:potassium channel family protein n=1 Tax=Psychrobacter sp. UBA5136 TaxID=1947356 RepID=UPI0025D984C5|nr:potassium channel family protein [Psychrobacter sp. UBA5136]
MLEKITTARGTLFIFVLVGSLWYLLTRFLPDNIWRDAITIGLAFPFCAIFMWSLFSTLQRIYGNDGNLWKELAMTTLNVFLFLLTFSALYYEVGIVDTTLDGNPITQDFWACCYYAVVTFTSTGYGDFRPQGISRVLASLHALIGYLVLGLLASTSLSVVKWTANGSGKNRGKKDN